MRAFLLLTGLLVSLTLFSTNIRVQVFTGTSISSLVITPASGWYAVYGDLIKTFDFKITPLYVKADKDSVVLKHGDTLIGKFSFLSINENVIDSIRKGSLKLKSLVPDRTPRIYEDNFLISAQGGALKIINDVEIEHYVAGVIQQEVGKMQPHEFNKLKAIIIRTYTLANLRKHELEYFNLCDQTHCQVYRGKCAVPNIIKALDETRELVLVDTSITLINASFFSNCGGQTCNSEDVWIKPLPYLRSVKDTFCTKQPSAYWQKKIPKKEWLKYFSDKFNYPVNDSANVKQLLSFSQWSRKVYFTETPVKIPLKTLREDWKLRSTFFSVEVQGDQVLLKGRGFGHGVGLCQEGAMRMAKKGYTAKQIIDFYYRDVILIDLDKLEFFKEQ